MRVTVDKSVFDQYGTNCVPTDSFHDFLMNMELKKSYVLSTDPSINAGDVQSKLDYLEFLVFSGIVSRSINQPTEPHSSDCVVIVGGQQDDIDKRFAPTEINEYLNSPATIVVENGKNDGCFVRAIMKHFAPSINFEEQLSNSFVVIDPASGSGAKSRIEYFLNIHHDQPKYLRCLVIVDGDKRFPGDNTYGSYQTQQTDGAYFQSKNVTYHVLEKRAMENYMPDEVFEHNRNVFSDDWVNAYLYLTEEQKDYYYIAEGFQKDIPNYKRQAQIYDWQDLPNGIQTLYRDVVQTANYHHLLKQPYHHGNFKNDFPVYFVNSPYVYKDSLLRRSPCNASGKSEIEEIAEKIRQLL